MSEGFRNGQEVGGVLLGRIQESPSGQTVVTVEDCDAVQLRGRRSFTFTPDEKDAKRLWNAIARRQGHTDSGLAPVGLARSHVRSGLYLDTADFSLLRNFFPGPGTVFLLARAEPGGNGGFFFWEDGDIQRKQPYLTFPFDREKLESSRPHTILLNPQKAIPESPAPQRTSRVFDRQQLIWLGLAMILILMSAGLWWGRRSGPNEKAASSVELGLDVDRLGAALQLKWNPRAGAVQSAKRGTLWITDGGMHKKIELDQRQLAHGSSMYVPVSDRVAFRLELHDQARQVVDSIVSVMPAAPGIPEAKPADPPAEGPKPAPIPAQVLKPAPKPLPPKPVAPRQSPTVASLRTEVEVASRPLAPVTAPEAPSAAIKPRPAPVPVPPVLDTTASFEPQPLPVVTIGFNQEPPSDPVRRKGIDRVPVLRLLHRRGGAGSSDDVVPPRPIQPVKPHVPMVVAGALPGDWRVDVRAHIDDRGRVSELESLSPGIDDRLTTLALNAVKRWDYQPATSNGRAVASSLVVSFRFHNPPQNPEPSTAARD